MKLKCSLIEYMDACALKDFIIIIITIAISSSSIIFLFVAGINGSDQP